MRFQSLLLAAACAAAPLSHAVGISISPASPTPADTLVIEITGAAPCASMTPQPVEMVGERVIRVRYNDGGNLACVPEMPPPRATLGRLPAGTYTVELIPFFGDGTPHASAPLSVTPSPGGVLDPPLDDYSGHYVTDSPGEGVSVTQSGRTAFVSYMHYDAQGLPTWIVMPDALYGVGEDGGFRFRGRAWRVRQLPGGGQLAEVAGIGELVPTGIHGRGLLRIFSGMPVERLLTRLRF